MDIIPKKDNTGECKRKLFSHCPKPGLSNRRPAVGKPGLGNGMI